MSKGDPQPGRDTPQFSVVVPVFNESANIAELHRRLTEFFRPRTDSYELLFVDDGSSDNSFKLLDDLRRADPRARIVKLSRNFGHHLAITAGLDHSRGSQVVLMDADLQDDPEDISRLIDKAGEGYDIVYGVRKERDDPLLKKLSSWLFITLMNRFAGAEIPLNSCVFRVISRRVVDHLKGFRERERYIIGLMSWLGFRQAGVDVRRAARFAGEAKYTLGRSFRLAFNVITSFSYVPLRLASYLGFLAAAAALALIVFLVAKKLMYGISVEGWVSTMVCIAFFGGVQLVCLGIIGEYIGRTYREVQQRPLYVVDEQKSDL